MEDYCVLFCGMLCRYCSMGPFPSSLGPPTRWAQGKVPQLSPPTLLAALIFPYVYMFHHLKLKLLTRDMPYCTTGYTNWSAGYINAIYNVIQISHQARIATCRIATIAHASGLKLYLYSSTSVRKLFIVITC